MIIQLVQATSLLWLVSLNGFIPYFPLLFFITGFFVVSSEKPERWLAIQLSFMNTIQLFLTFSNGLIETIHSPVAFAIFLSILSVWLYVER